jgi:methylenetetrahydrofolate reductase (NADPH)
MAAPSEVGTDPMSGTVSTVDAGLQVSFEFFPPKSDEGAQRLRSTAAELARRSPHFFSVTYGAGGSTRERTLGAVLDLIAAGYPAAPHLSCVGASRAETAALLDGWRERGIRRIVALRGDLPSGSVGLGDLRYASDLVAFIREQTGDHFHIEVACYPEVHPQARSARDDLAALRRKVEAGADSAITQYFFNPDAYLRFVDEVRAAGIAIPIIPGIMPIANFSQLARFSEACGAEIPRWLRLRMQDLGDDAPAIRAFGLDVVTDLCARLLEGGAPGLHFYTMNQASLSGEICNRLGIGQA